tara:strand:- start:13681 stop:14139 length:459 start_codon:yes stop_codon:yes gene_type:complete
MKKLLIAHRGNTTGPNPERENSPSYIIEAINKGFDCEVDLRYENRTKKLYLGHRFLDYEISYEWLNSYKENIWIHCKNFEALEYLNTYGSIFNYFWHESDRFTLTSQGYIWTYPENKVGNKSIIVEFSENHDRIGCLGVCSDYVEKLENKFF